MSKKLKERKKKNKNIETRQKLIFRREAIIKKKKRDREIDNDVNNVREKIIPFINPDKEKIRKQEQLENNLKTIKALEEEYKREQNARKKINDKLELEGAVTLQEKIDLMGKQANQLAEKSETLVEKTNKILTKVRGKEILEGEMLNEFRKNNFSTKEIR
jgi:hypothetical protein